MMKGLGSHDGRRGSAVPTIAAVLALIIGATMGPVVEAKCVKKDKATKAANTKGGVYRITFTKSGGFAATHQKYELDSNKLEKNDQAALSDLIGKTGVLNETSSMKTTPGAADMFFYEFKVDYKGKPHRISMDDGTMTQAYRDLAGFVTKNGVKVEGR